MSETEDKLHVHVIPDDRENVRPNGKSKLSECNYHNKYANTDTSAHDRVLNTLNKLDPSYNPTISIMHEPFTERKYKETGGTRVVLVVM